MRSYTGQCQQHGPSSYNVGSSKGNVLGYRFLLTSFDSGQLITWELARPGETPESTAVHGSKKYLTALLVFA